MRESTAAQASEPRPAAMNPENASALRLPGCRASTASPRTTSTITIGATATAPPSEDTHTMAADGSAANWRSETL